MRAIGCGCPANIVVRMVWVEIFRYRMGDSVRTQPDT